MFSLKLVIWHWRQPAISPSAEEVLLGWDTKILGKLSIFACVKLLKFYHISMVIWQFASNKFELYSTAHHVVHGGSL